MYSYHVKSPVLFLIFNRPDTTQEVFDKIRAAKPSYLYIAADGPRKSREGEESLCQEARKVIATIDWECNVRTLFRAENLGCKIAVSSAIDWFFENVEEGIILEDDCLPSDSFFYFCDEMLDTYRTDNRIRHITGTNLQMGKRWGESSYYFSEMTNIWGWATWKRVWKDYDKDLKNYNQNDAGEQLKNIFSDPFLINQWLNIFQELKAGKIDTWDYQLAFLNYFNHGLSVNPNINLVTNIGFRSDATHTPDPNSAFSRLKTGVITDITHPQYVLPQKEADYQIFAKEFKLAEKRRKHFSIRRRLKRALKNIFK